MSYESVNINNMNLRNEVISYDPDAELNSGSMTVPEGTYLIRLGYGKYGIKDPATGESQPVALTTTKAGKPQVQAAIEATIIAPGTKYDGFRVSGRVSSLVFENSGTSAIHQLLKAVGTPAPAQGTLGDLENLVNAALQGGAQCNTKLRWEASTKNSDGSYMRVKGMRKFPQRTDGTYDPNYNFSLADGSEVTVEARPEFNDFQPSGVQAAG